MRIVFIGCVSLSYAALQATLKAPAAEVVGVVTRRDSRFNAEFVSLAPLAEEKGIPFHIAEGNDQGAMAAWIAERGCDIIYCFGWSYLLGADILTIPVRGVVGFHPAALPKNRGRHPLIWALALGLKETASTFFFMDEGADAGPIVSQIAIPIGDGDDAASLYETVTRTAVGQIAAFTPVIADGTLTPRLQDNAQANYWRKRGKEDGRIDWRMSARSIGNLTRALTRPYIGAHCQVGDREVKIWRTSPGPATADNIEPGKVLAVDGYRFLVRCGEGSVWVEESEFGRAPEKGTYL
jgi:methionyl-tRNA formyltransferase